MQEAVNIWRPSFVENQAVAYKVPVFMDYVIPKENPVRERNGEVMGGQVLMLKSEEIRQEGIAQGIAQGIEEGRNKEKRDTAIRMRKANIPIESIAVFIDATVGDTISLLTDAGFPCNS